MTFLDGRDKIGMHLLQEAERLLQTGESDLTILVDNLTAAGDLLRLGTGMNRLTTFENLPYRAYLICLAPGKQIDDAQYKSLPPNGDAVPLL